MKSLKNYKICAKTILKNMMFKGKTDTKIRTVYGEEQSIEIIHIIDITVLCCKAPKCGEYLMINKMSL